MATTSERSLAPEMIREELPEKRSLGYVGMVLFLGSWAMMFGALFFCYAMLRIRAPFWPPLGMTELPLALPGTSTLLLLLSSATMVRALSGLRRGRLAQFRLHLLATIVLGSLFTALQCAVWIELWNSGLRLDSGPYGGLFYLLTVFHGLHVVVGLGLLLWLLGPTLRRKPTAPRRVPVTLASMFWHGVDLVWVVMFLTVYVL
jgi:heme/copper-type cytochrome/quinol oxidase subunit 3